MVGDYNASNGSLELRKPEKIFAPLAWLVAGPLNPAGFFGFVTFEPVYWIVSVAIPLSIGCAGVLFFLRDGGFGLITLILLTILITAASCALSGPAYTFALWALAETGIYVSYWPLGSTEELITTSGTFIQLGFSLLAMPILPAALLLRLIAFRREAPKKKQVSASTLEI